MPWKRFFNNKLVKGWPAGDIYEPIYTSAGKFNMRKMKEVALQEILKLFKDRKITFLAAPEEALSQEETPSQEVTASSETLNDSETEDSD